MSYRLLTSKCSALVRAMSSSSCSSLSLVAAEAVEAEHSEDDTDDVSPAANSDFNFVGERQACTRRWT